MFSKTLFALLAALAINAQTISTPVRRAHTGAR